MGVFGWAPQEPLCVDSLGKAPDPQLQGSRARPGESLNCEAAPATEGHSGTGAAFKGCPAWGKGVRFCTLTTDQSLLAAPGEGHSYGRGGLLESNFHRGGIS